MSFQAYLDTIEKKTGKTPADLRAMGAEKGWTEGDTLAPGVKPMAIVTTLKGELGWATAMPWRWWRCSRA